MSSPVTPMPASGQEEAGKLIEQRGLLKSWLARLEECSTDVPEHITARVRGDYEERLRLIAEQLGPHSEGFRQELDEMRELLGVAEEAHTVAADALGEAQLRQRIGEIAADRWTQQEQELRSAVDAADAERQRVRRECERLGELLSEIEGEQESAPAPDETPTGDSPDLPLVEVEPEPVAVTKLPTLPETVGSGAVEEAEGAADLPWLALIDSVAGEGDELDADAEMDPREFDEWLAGADDEEVRLGEDTGFLEELDRAIAASAGASPPRTLDNGRSHAADSGTRSTLVCKECGSVNDSRTWYCEICGAELS